MHAERRDRDFDSEFGDDHPPRRPPRNDNDPRDDYADGPGGVRRGPAGGGVNVWGIISLILGIIGLVMSLIPCVGFVAGIPLAAIGLALGIIGLYSGRRTGRGYLIAGICVSAAALLVGGLWLAIGADFAAHWQGL